MGRSDVMYYVTVVIGVELYHGTQKDPVILHKVIELIIHNIYLYIDIYYVLCIISAVF